jgi:ABC-type branched-subunit amino acid transport system permease subunit
MGPAVGTLLFFTLSEFFIELTDNFQLFLGIAMVIIVLGLPEGVVPSLRNKLNL